MKKKADLKEEELMIVDCATPWKWDDGDCDDCEDVEHCIISRQARNKHEGRKE